MTQSTRTAAAALITPELVQLDADFGSAKTDVITALAGAVVRAGRATSTDGLVGDALKREEQSPTGLPGGLAIPHCRSAHVTAASLSFARLKPGVDFGAPDGPADLAFLIAAPAEGDADHLTLLAALARSLVKPDFVAALRAATTREQVVDLVAAAVAPPEAAPQTAPSTATGAHAAAPAPSGQSGARSIVAITACPTGIAHTYMAADSLVAAGERAGVTVIVETQGSAGTTPFTAEQIAAASAVIFATDVGVKGRERFAGKPVIASGVKRAINEPDVMVADALRAADDPQSARVAGDASQTATSAGSSDVSFGMKLRQALLTGVSYMIPFVAAGGLLIALGFLLGGYRITDVAADVVLNNSLFNLPDAAALNAVTPDLPGSGLLIYLGAVLFQLGGLAFSFLVPALAGYIAFAIADRPGIAPGFTVGAIAGFVGAGFIGGLVGGLLAGVAALYIGRIKVPKAMRGLMPVVIIPLGATLIAGGLMFIVLGQPLAAVTTGLTSWLTGLSGSSAVLLGVILGLMMAFDLGGPVNKAAYAFAVAGLNPDVPATLQIMAAVMAAGMVPPLAMALATTIRKRLFSPAEQENGKTAWLLGASFISEGAIPFAAADPLRVIPSSMVGAAVTGALVMASGATLQAPHGGIFVFFAMNGVVYFFGALVVGTIISGLMIIALKTQRARSLERKGESLTV